MGVGGVDVVWGRWGKPCRLGGEVLLEAGPSDFLASGSEVKVGLGKPSFFAGWTGMLWGPGDMGSRDPPYQPVSD